MKDIAFAYSKGELAWVSDKLTLTGNTALTVSLKDTGKVVIKKQNSADAPAPKINVSEDNTRFEYTFRGEAEGKIIQVFTSTEPNYMRYGNF